MLKKNFLLIISFCMPIFVKGSVRHYSPSRVSGIELNPVSGNGVPSMVLSNAYKTVGHATMANQAISPGSIPKPSGFERRERAHSSRQKSKAIPAQNQMQEQPPYCYIYVTNNGMQQLQRISAMQMQGKVTEIVDVTTLESAHVQLNTAYGQSLIARYQVRHEGASTVQKYALSADDSRALQQVGLKAHEFKQYTGTPAQQLLHNDILNIARQLYKAQELVDQNSTLHPFYNIAQRAVFAANQCKSHNAIPLAQWCVDVSYEACDFMYRYGYAVGKGALRGVANTTIHPVVLIAHGAKQFVYHPITSTQRVVSSLMQLCSTLARVSSVGAGVHCDFTDNPALYTEFEEYHAHLAREEGDQLRQLWREFRSKPGEEQAEAYAEFLAQWIAPSLLGKGLSAATKIKSVANGLSIVEKALDRPARVMRRYTDFFKQLSYAAETAEVGSTERIFAALADIEEASPGNLLHLIEKGPSEIAHADKMSRATQVLLPELAEASNVITKKVDPYICADLAHLKWHIITPEPIRAIVHTAEIHELARHFDGIAHGLKEIEAKTLRFGYRHYFTPEIHCKTPKQLVVKGFHHDYLGKIENSGALSIQKTIAENVQGCYKVEWGYLNSKVKPSTMFPKHWTREQVMIAVQEAISTGVFQRVEEGNYSFKGICKAGFEIKFYVKADGLVVSAFPVL